MKFKLILPFLPFSSQQYDEKNSPEKNKAFSKISESEICREDNACICSQNHEA